MRERMRERERERERDCIDFICRRFLVCQWLGKGVAGPWRAIEEPDACRQRKGERGDE